MTGEEKKTRKLMKGNAEGKKKISVLAVTGNSGGGQLTIPRFGRTIEWLRERGLLTDTQLEALLDSESDRVERKRSLSDPDRIQEAICAFANDMPGHGEAGVVFIGIEDDGSCAGQTINDQLLLQVAQMRE